MTQRTVAAVSVVIPTYNNAAEVVACLESLQAQSIPPRKVLVCVDGSTDDTIDRLQAVAGQGPASVAVLTHPGGKHQGRAATRNLGLSRIEGDYVWFLDSDMVAEPDALEAHLAVASGDACASQGLIVYSNATRAEWAGYLNTRAHHRASHGAKIPFNWFSTANSMVRAAYVSTIGGFNPRFVTYGGEDVDFAYRLEQSSGQPVVNNTRAVVRTIEEKTVEQAVGQLEEFGSSGLRLLVELHPAMPRPFDLERLESTAWTDRAFVALVNPVVEQLVDAALRVSPQRLRRVLLNYKVIAAVWRGYRDKSEDG